MSATTRVIFGCMVIALLGGPAAHAWGPEGHRIVAHIAESRLTDKARLALSQILAPNQKLSDNMICNWPDYIRRDRRETAPWHYVNIPHDATHYDADTMCPDGQCVVHQIDVMAEIVADRARSWEARNEALRFLVHFVGDMHQPLHCSSNDGDLGGNLRPVFYPGDIKTNNLHSVWDGNLVRSAMSPLGALEFADKLNANISWWRARQWARGTTAEWAWESHMLAVEYAYTILPPKEGPPAEIDDKYIKTGKRVVTKQLMKAGVRLAAILNRSLREPAPE